MAALYQKTQLIFRFKLSKNLLMNLASYSKALIVESPYNDSVKKDTTGDLLTLSNLTNSLFDFKKLLAIKPYSISKTRITGAK